MNQNLVDNPLGFEIPRRFLEFTNANRASIQTIRCTNASEGICLTADDVVANHLAAVESSIAGAPAAGPAVAGAADLPLVVVAERAAWVRVYLDSGTIIFEKILEKGETYTPPAGVGAPKIWAGNAGSVYVRVGDKLHGPLGSGTRAVRDVVLSSQAIAERFAEVAVVPEVISQAIGAGQPALAAPIEIQ